MPKGEALRSIVMTGKVFESMSSALDEAIQAKLYPKMEWDGVEWFCDFDKGDGTGGWGATDKDLARAIKKTYYSWKGIYFNEDVD